MDPSPDPLKRHLRLFPATNIVVADMIGTGIFTTSGLVMLQLGNPLLMLALWVGGGLLALAGALCYGALGARMPRAGGEYAYLSEMFHPSLGFLSGWVSFFVGFSAPLAASSLGFSEYLASAFPSLNAAEHAHSLKKAIAVAVLLGLTAVHLRGMAFGARIQNYLTVGKVALIGLLVVLGFAVGRGDLGGFAERAAVDGPGPSWKGIGLSLMWIMFAYSGWNASGYIGSEIEAPGRNLPRSLLLGTSVVLVLYVSLNALFVYAVPPAEMQGVIAVGGLAASHLFGPVAERLVSLLIAFALLSAIGALIMLGPRVYYAMARDGYFFKTVAHVHPEHRIPSRAIMLQCVIATVMVLSGTFDQILTYMGFCLGLFPILAVLAVFKLPAGAEGGIRPAGYSLAAALFASVSLGMLVLAFCERPVESTVGLVTVGIGIPFYVAFARRRREASVQPAMRTVS